LQAFGIPAPLPAAHEKSPRKPLFSGALLNSAKEKLSLGELGCTTGGVQTVLVLSQKPFFLDITGFLGHGLQFSPHLKPI